MKMFIGAIGMAASVVFNQHCFSQDTSQTSLIAQTQVEVPFGKKTIPMYVLAFQDCNDALVRNTVNQSTFSLSDLSIALNMSEGTWQQEQQALGVNAIIYGVPIGGSYNDFEKTVHTLAETLNIRDFAQYANSYASSRLDDNALQAYRDCLAHEHGLAVVAGRMGNTANGSYTIWVTYAASTNPQKGLKGHVGNVRNLDPQTKTNITDEIAKDNFAQDVDRQFVLAPQDPNKEVSLEVDVGDDSKSITLPPLVAPQLQSLAVIDPNTTGICAGYCGGQAIYGDLKGEGCFVPTRADAKFIPGTEHFQESTIRVGSWEFSYAQPDKICVRVHASNTSGTNSSVEQGHIIATEAWVQ
jgi:hypothetical protein